MNSIPNVTLLNEILAESQKKAAKKVEPLVKELENAQNSDGDTTRTEYTDEENKKVTDEYNRFFKESIDEIASDRIKNLKETMQSPGWAFFLEIVKKQNPNFKKGDFSNFVEQMAFKGFRSQIIDDVLNLPEQVVNYYDALSETVQS